MYEIIPFLIAKKMSGKVQERKSAGFIALKITDFESSRRSPVRMVKKITREDFSIYLQLKMIS